MWGLFNFSSQFGEHFGKNSVYWKIHVRWAKTPHILVLSYLKEVILQAKSHIDIHCIVKVKTKQEIKVKNHFKTYLRMREKAETGRQYNLFIFTSHFLLIWCAAYYQNQRLSKVNSLSVRLHSRCFKNMACVNKWSLQWLLSHCV